jgi:hypothetical protein
MRWDSTRASFPAPGTARDDPPRSNWSGSQQPARATAGDLPKGKRLLTVCGAAPAVRGVGRHAPTNRGTRTGEQVRCVWLPPDLTTRGWVSGSSCPGAVSSGPNPKLDLTPPHSIWLDQSERVPSQLNTPAHECGPLIPVERPALTLAILPVSEFPDAAKKLHPLRNGVFFSSDEGIAIAPISRPND